MTTDVTNVDAGRIRLALPHAQSLAERALLAMGFPEGEARIIADHVIDAALCGYEYSGLPKILNIRDHARLSQERKALSVQRETVVSALLDGGNNNGMVAMFHLANIAIEKATGHGFAVVGVNNTWMSGRSAYYAERVARAGLVCMHSVSSFRHVAPPGAAAAATGTNPIAFGFPTDREVLVIDMGSSELVGTDLLFRQRRNELLPEGVALAADGRPTRDPAAAVTLLPFGGYRGFVLAFAMQALGVLAGSGYGADKMYGHLIVAIDPELMLARDDFMRQMSTMIDGVKSVRRQPGVAEIRIPSERAFRERAVNRVKGLEIDVDIYRQLQALAGG